MSVADHGAGLLPGEEQRVFDKFYRARPEGATGGAGLGLAICRAIVEAHRGRIWAENRADGGVRSVSCCRSRASPSAPQPEIEATTGQR